MNQNLIDFSQRTFGIILFAAIVIVLSIAISTPLVFGAVEFSPNTTIDQNNKPEAQTELSAVQNTTYSLTEIDPVISDSGWGPVEIDQHVGGTGLNDGGPLQIVDEVFDKGFGVQATSVMSFDLEGKCSSFSTQYGVDISLGMWKGSVQFLIYADGTLVHQSPIMSSGNEAASSSQLSMSGVDELMLVVNDGSGDYYQDRANWVEPEIVCTSKPGGDGSSYRHIRGDWDPVMNWPVKAIHATLLPDGYIVSHASVDPGSIAPGDPSLDHDYTKIDLSNISTWSHEWVDHTTQEMYCSAHTLLSDGTLFEFGGHDGDAPIGKVYGKTQASIFDLESKSWEEVTHMEQARWYPTAVTLGNGDVLSIGGSNGENNIYKPEVYDGSDWRTLSNVDYSNLIISNNSYFDHTYPFVHLVSDGRVFWSGWDEKMAYIDTNGSGSWGQFYNREDQFRLWGSPVMYEQDKILLIGGLSSDNVYAHATHSTVKIDLTNGAPQTSFIDDMLYARTDADGTIMANGEILVNGGAFYHFLGFNPTQIFTPEIWNPDTGKWTIADAATNPRTYHSSSLLLPDGRIWTGGGECGGDCDLGKTAQIFNPPYLYKKDGSGDFAPRPVINSATDKITYGESFSANVSASEGIEKITFIRYGTSTHHFNFEQRIHELEYTKSGNNLTITAPANGNLAPPGFYMMFIIDGDGVPSVSKTIQILPEDNSPEPTPVPSPTITPTPEAGQQWEIVSSTDNSTALARHENGYVELNGKFYLIGGRNSRETQVFDPVAKTWTNLGLPPLEFHHFQPVAYGDKIYIVGGLVGEYPVETPLTHVYVFDPAENNWYLGGEIPEARQRGAGGTVVHNGKIYVVGGSTNGHSGGYVKWLDEFDPLTGAWTAKADAPTERDHFSAVIIDNKIYAAGGRQTDQPNPFDGEIYQVDVYNIATDTWGTLSSGIPTMRAGAMVVGHGSDLIVIGGESNSLTSAHDDVDSYDTGSDSWSQLPDLFSGRHGTGAVVWDNSIYVAAGSGGQGGGPELTGQESLKLEDLPATPTPTLVPENSLPLTPAPSIGPPQTPTPAGPSPVAGSILREVWTEISGHEVIHLTREEDYPDSPDISEEIDSFEAPEDFGDQYGQRIHGYVHPPVTGNYQFWIASDNKSELWLSSSEDPENAIMIAFVDGVTPPQNFETLPEQASNTVSLVAGRRYYISALHKELNQGDHLAVAWAYPGQSREIIQGEDLSPFGSIIPPTPTPLPTETPTETADPNSSPTPTVEGTPMPTATSDAPGATPMPTQTPTTPEPPSDTPIISIGDVELDEGDEGNTVFSFMISLSQPSTDNVSVAFRTVDNGAEAGTDYEAKSGKISIAAGQMSAKIIVQVIGDLTAEPNEAFIVELSEPTNGTLSEKRVATGWILNDDGSLLGPDAEHSYLPFIGR